jgi:hypothetical protein
MGKNCVFTGISIVLIVAFFCGCMTSTPPAIGANDRDLGVVCKTPYIRFANTCCLDMNGNAICDKDETPTTLAQVATTTIASVATSVTTLPLPPTTMAAQTTTTNVASAVACNTNSDCGTAQSTLKCSGNNVVTYTETPSCSHPGQPNAQCIVKTKTTPYQECDSTQNCINGICVTTVSGCTDACVGMGYSPSAYCTSSPSCDSPSDVRGALGDAECLTYGSTYCCCASAASTTTTTTLASPPISSSTTTLSLGPGVTLGPLFHKACVSGTCKTVIGTGPNLCTTNAQCFIGPTLPETHKSCVGTTCKSVAGPGVDTCTTNIQCMGTVVTISPAVTLNPVVTTISIPKYIPQQGW